MISKSNFRKGFSLIELMIVTGALSGVALIVMQLNKSATRTQGDAIATSDYIDFRKETDFLIENSNNCSAGLKGVTFRGSTIKTTAVPVELWTADQKGQRSRKRFSATDLQYNKSGKVIVDSIGLTMPDYTAGTDFPKGPGHFNGNIVIRSSTFNMGKTKKIADIQKSISVTFETDSLGLSSIKSCGVLNSSPVLDTELSGTINGSSGEIKLPEGNLNVTLIATYNYCNNTQAILYFNGAKVGEADAIDTDSCEENVIMTTTAVESNGASYSVKIVPKKEIGPDSIKWFAVPK